ncbi:MAG: glycine oxidase ThiO [Gemmatimonadaceae bacterium]
MALTADVSVVGAGIIGLCTAAALARQRLKVVLIGEQQAGEASAAAAGMLAPSVERATGPANDFAIAARDLYPGWLAWLAEETGISVPLNRLGAVQIAISEKGVKGLRKSAPASAFWLDRQELARLEPPLAHGLGAMFNPLDGAVDNVALVRALEQFVDASSYVTRVSGHVVSVLPRRHSQSVVLRSGETVDSARVVLAPGAWGKALAESARCLRFVRPVRGQLVAFDSIGLRHVIYGPRGYLVPRASSATIAGSTMERVGFDATTTPEGVAKVRSAAEEIAPALAAADVAATWAGLRPVTPDMLPLLGPDADNPSLIHACGHSRNGILLAPLTGDVVAALVSGAPVNHDLSQFRPDRF